MSIPSLPPAPELRLASKVAWMYHSESRKQTEIAHELHISQSRVSRLLQLAAKAGIVKTTVYPPPGVFTELEAEMEQAFGLEQCILVQSRESEEAMLNDLGIAAASYLQTTLLGGETIGISSWSATWLQAAKQMTPFKDKVAKSIVQLVGGAGSPRVQAQATWLLTHLAELTGAAPIFLQTPGIVRDSGVRRALLEDPSVQETVEAWDRLSLALLGIGNVEPSPLLRDSGNVAPSIQQEVAALGGVGDICFRYFDDRGHALEAGFDDRIVGITEEQLRAVPRRVGAAGGLRKVPAILAALRGGWLDVLITDTDTAHAALSAPPS